MVTSTWANVERRLQMRAVVGHCMGMGQAAVDLLFFMGDPAGSALGETGARQEADHFGDMVFLGGPDTDPLPRHGEDPNLRVLDGVASARAHRWAHGAAWLLEYRPDLEYLVQFDDQVLVSLPGLLAQVVSHANTSLALGWISWASLTIGETAYAPCETCKPDTRHVSLCTKYVQRFSSGMEMRGCLAVAQRCCDNLSSDGGNQCGGPGDLEACVAAAQEAGAAGAAYFGAIATPRLLHEACWVLGRRLVEFLAQNADDLKMRGAPRLLLGFWLAAVEDVHFVTLPEEALLEAAGGETHCSAPQGLLAAQGLGAEKWGSWLDMGSCELRCPAPAELASLEMR